MPPHTTPGPRDDASTLRLTRTCTAGPDVVWRAWTEELAAWLWPERLATEVTFEPRVGAPYRIVSEVAGIAVGGEVVEVEPPRLLVMTWRWDGDPRETRVRVVLGASVGGGTELLLEHSGHESADQRAEHEEGWTHCLDRLLDHVDGPR